MDEVAAQRLGIRHFEDAFEGRKRQGYALPAMLKLGNASLNPVNQQVRPVDALAMLVF